MPDKPNIKAWRVYEKGIGRQVDVVFYLSDCDQDYVERSIQQDYSMPVTVVKPKARKA